MKHQADRQQRHIPHELRHLDTAATWSKSIYHGLVDSYGFHLTVNHAGFPLLIGVETTAFSEKAALARKETIILNDLRPETLCGDDAYTTAKRIRAWAEQGIALLSPACAGTTGAMLKLTVVSSSNSTWQGYSEPEKPRLNCFSI